MEQQSVIKFLVQKNKTNAEIINELISVYGANPLKSTAVTKWGGGFPKWKKVGGNDARAGQPGTVCNARNTEKVKSGIEKDHQKTIRDVTDSTDISHTSVHKIWRQNLEMKKVCSKLLASLLEAFFISQDQSHDTSVIAFRVHVFHGCIDY